MEKVEKQEVGSRIKNIRTELGLTLEQFGLKIDGKTTKVTVRQWEIGQNLPNAERILRIAEIGSQTPSYILKGNENMGTRIRDIRKNLGLSMADFAKIVDPPAASSNVSNWENNKVKPNAARTNSIAELGGVTIDYLLYGSASFQTEELLDFEYSEILNELYKLLKMKISHQEISTDYILKMKQKLHDLVDEISSDL